MPETQVVSIQCPNCGTPFQAPVRNVIDVGREPRLRQAFLAGQVNLAICPNCKHGGLLEMPLVYHDPAAEFLAIYFPAQLNIPEMERQKMIGQMTQALMNSLPTDQRKGYFLNPRQFMNRQNLTDAILGTMGISQEELDRQRKKMKLLDQLMVMADDPKGLQMMVKGQDAMLDYEFFMILSNILEQTQAAGDEAAVKKLETLRANLMQLTTWGKRIARQEAAVRSLEEVKTPEDLLEKVVSAEFDEAEAMTVAARPLMDYAFFQKLTERIDAARGPEQDRLRQLRERLLAITDKVDASARAELDAATALLKEILGSPSPRSAVRERYQEIDDVFMSVLSYNMQAAERQGAKEALARLAMVYDEMMQMVQEGMPPEIQLINELLAALYPDGARELLKENRDALTPEVLGLIDELIQDMSQREDAEAAQTAKRLRDIKSQAMLLV